jgi:hypothetical protein
VSVAAEQVERPPAECCGLGRPAAIQERSAIVHELEPPLPRHIVRRPSAVEAGESFSPCPRRAAIVFNNGRSFLMGVGPAIRSVHERAGYRQSYGLENTIRGTCILDP